MGYVSSACTDDWEFLNSVHPIKHSFGYPYGNFREIDELFDQTLLVTSLKLSWFHPSYLGGRFALLLSFCHFLIVPISKLNPFK